MEKLPKRAKLDKKASKPEYVCERCKSIVLKTVRIDIEYLVNFYQRLNSCKYSKTKLIKGKRFTKIILHR